MTFNEIFANAATERTSKNNVEAANETERKASLINFFQTFFLCFELANTYTLKGLPFISGEKTINQIKNNIENQISNIENDPNISDEKKRISGSIDIKVKKDLKLVIRFINNYEKGNIIRIQEKTDIMTLSEDYQDQELAAAHLAKLVMKYKD